MAKASWIAGPSSSALVTRMLCFVTDMVTPMTSVSWKLSFPMAGRATCPVMATMGTESIKALARPVTRLVAPGPEVEQQTPTWPVMRA